MRKVEAFVGEYASGKSEVAVNRALQLSQYRKVVLVDMDLREPFYTLRPLKNELENENLEVITPTPEEAFGLGERGPYLLPGIKGVLWREADIVFDAGHGPEGKDAFNLVEGVQGEAQMRYLAVINIARPLTSTAVLIYTYVRSLGHIDGLINNSHLGAETDLEIICRGAEMVTAAARRLQVPVEATTAERSLAQELGKQDPCGNPVRPLILHMQRAYWS